MSDRVNGTDHGEPERWLSGTSGEGDEARARALIAGAEAPRVPGPHARARVFARIEATNHARLRRGNTLGWAAAGAAAGALAVFVMLRVTAPSVDARTARIMALEGTVQAGERAQPMAAARVGQLVRSGARVRTNAGSKSVVRVADIGDLHLAAETEVSLSLDELDRRGAEVALHAGGLVAVIERAEPVRTVAFTTGAWTVRVLGTRFTVMRDGPDDITVEVAEGTVEVDGPDTHVRVTTGERFSSREARRSTAARVRRTLEAAAGDARASTESLARGAAGQPRPREAAGDVREASEAQRSTSSAREATAREAREAAGEARGTSSARETTAREAREAAGEARSTSSARETTARDASEAARSTSSARETTARDASEAARSTSSARDVSARETTARALEAAPRELSAREAARDPTDEPDRSPSPADLYAAARAETNPLRAIALFDAVAATRSPHAEVAALQAARITMRIGRCTDAVARFEGVLAKYPRTAYAQEARLNVLECHIRLGELQRAEKDLGTFLASHPTSERSPELRFLRAELHRSRGDHRAAARDYEGALGSRRDDDARYFLGWCQIQINATADARKTLETYLERHPDGRHASDAREALARLEKKATTR